MGKTPAGAMAQWVKHFHKHGVLNLDPQYTTKASIVACTCNSSPDEKDT